MLSFLAAFQFLATLPIKRDFTAEQVGRSTAWFPLVGLVIGVVLGGLNWLLGLVLPSNLVSALLVVLLVIFTGGMHLDGLMDTCDGIGGHRTPEERWRVMHDSRVGGFGVIGAVLIILLKYVALSEVRSDLMLFTLIAATTLSRWAMVYAIFAYPYARPEGLGKSFKTATGSWQFIIATVVAAVVTMVLFGWPGLIILLLMWLVTVGLAYYLKGKFAGLTGDTYGMINEVVEASAFIIVVLLAFTNIV